MMMMLRALLFGVFLIPSPSYGHSLSDSFLELGFNQSEVSGYWLIAVQDLELAVGLDSNLDGRVNWGEVRGKRAEIERYALSRIRLFSGETACALSLSDPMIEERNSNVYLHLGISGSCANGGAIRLEYNLLFDIDSSHRGIVTLQRGEEIYTLLLSPNNPSVTLPESGTSAWFHYWTFLIEGVWHIWIGLDHILFLVALLVPIVIRRSGETTPAAGMFIQILKVVTAFTVAHSVTLILATLEWIVLPARLVESLIALSVAVTGLNIIYPIFRGRHWQIAFGFGLIHGFGFAGVLGDLSLPAQLFIGSLLSFNVGVEIGQLIIVLVLVPVLLILGNAALTRKLTVVTTGVAITGFGVLWTVERYWNLTLAGMI